MSFKAIQTNQAPAAIGPYSQAIQAQNLLFLSGQIGLDPHNGNLVAGGFEAQLQQIFKNIQAVVEAAKGRLENIAKLTVYVTDLKDFAAVNELMKQVFKEPYPARTTIQVTALPREALVELDAIVVL
ncbi:MAG: RidA family protein [Proteobacteria bacterium]|nr:RidA family protein [Pseudomonadota bacterium]